MAPVDKKIASQQGWRTGGLEGSSLEAWRAGLEGRSAMEGGLQKKARDWWIAQVL